jgi:rhamnose utilization protein RhaD (predicted bifunctional aldolase and dehydrogenase)
MKESEFADLVSLSTRIGRNPLLVQASSGNTSIKDGGTLWIKASGKWLAYATDQESFLPVNLAEVKTCVRQNLDYSGRASIETAMHAVLPQRVVIHVHSVNTIAWAVRQDAPERLAERLSGLAWQWIPYVPSGLPLALAVAQGVAYSPTTNIFVLGNHGLVVCGEDCDSAETLLSEIEKRVAIAPRPSPAWDPGLSAEIDGFSQWRLPEADELHALGTDPSSRKILSHGILYPCQAVFLGQTTPLLQAFSSTALERQPFCIVEGRGVVISEWMTRTQYAILRGMGQVLQRIEESAPIRHLTEAELTSLLSVDAHRYRQCAEQNALSLDSRRA